MKVSKTVFKKFLPGIVATTLVVGVIGVAAFNKLPVAFAAGAAAVVGGSYDEPVVGGSYDGPVVGGSYDGPVVGGSYDVPNYGGIILPTIPTVGQVEKKMDKAGGTIELSDKSASIVLEDGALTELKNIKVEKVTEASFKVAKPSGLKVAGTVISILADGGHLQLNKPALITLKYDKDALAGKSASRLGVFYEDEKSGKWVYQGAVLNTVDETIAFKTNHFSTYAVFFNGKDFSDLGQAAWAKDAFDVAFGANMIDGYTDGTFKPKYSITRAEFVQVLVSALGLSTDVAAGDSKFADVTEGKWYYKSVVAASKAGLASGKSAGTFAPDAQVTREEMAAFIARAFDLQGHATISFKDAAQISSFAQDAVDKAVAAGVINGYDGKFSPKDNASRAEAVQMIVQSLKNVGKVKL